MRIPRLNKQLAAMRLLLVLSSAILPAFTVRAAIVDKETAKKHADYFLQSNFPATKSSSLAYSPALDSFNFIGVRGMSESPSFYVFNFENNEGFIIVSAEDKVIPILAYSLSGGHITPDSVPDAMTGWMENIDAQISLARKHPAIAKASDDSGDMTSEKEPVELETALWNQDEPFNNQCPMDNGVRSYTGCVPTAAAIIMRYYRWPEKGSGTTVSYTGGHDISVPARNLDHTYDWDSMPLSYDSYSKEQADAVSTLMADIGAALQVDYSSEGTGGWLKPYVMSTNFGYSPEAQSISRDNYSDEEWHGILQDQLDRHRPVAYSGYDPTASGHEFVLDGYHQYVLDGHADKPYYRVNWGWGGYANGYFTLDDLHGDIYNFNESQSAVINLYPGEGKSYDNWITLSGVGLQSSTTRYSKGVPFVVRGSSFTNHTPVGYTGKARLARIDWQGNIKEWVSSETNMKVGSFGNQELNISCMIDGVILPGDRIKVFYQDIYRNQWYPINAIEGSMAVDEIPIARKSISQTTSFSFDKNTRTVTLISQEGVEVTVSSSSGTPVSGIVRTEGTNTTIDFMSVPDGKYKIILKLDNEIRELEFGLKKSAE